MELLINELMFITSHKMRKSLCTSMGLLNLIEAKGNNSPEELMSMLQHLKVSLDDLDEETKRMSLLLHDNYTGKVTFQSVAQA